ncbi:repressor LexA [Candidatus Peregrinibacteria bacterium]|nr:repressor LexA [Candidatus Peregrinibacteria bacterium]
MKSILLTAKQKQLLKLINNFHLKNNYFPSTRDLSTLSGIKSSNTIFIHLKGLLEKGYLKKNLKGQIIAIAHKPFNFEQFTNSKVILSESSFSIPYYPSGVPAGFQAPAEDSEREMITVDQYLIKSPNNTFALKVKGNSMEKAGIMTEDLLLVEKRTDAKPGQIIVAHLPSGFTVKRLIEEKGQLYLKAESSQEYQIRLEEGTEIWGIVVGIVRKYN